MPFTRLRWQLTASHLLAIVITLLSMIACVAVVAASWLGSGPTREPGGDARAVAAAIGGMVQNGASAEDLNPILRGMANGSLRLAVGFTGPDRRGGPGPAFGLSDIAYIVLLDPSGAVLASSDGSGAAFVPGQAAATGSASISDRSGRTLATVVVGSNSQQPEVAGGFDALRGLAIFGAASVAVLLASSVFAILSASVVAFFLSRPLVRRLERLGAAAEAMAAGDLSQRVESGEDEVGQLGQRFNVMAADLERSIGEGRAERDRITGLLEERRQMIATASHELRTPVAMMRGYLESALARTADLPDDIAVDLNVVQREVMRLQRLIEDLFALSQAAVGRLSLRLEPTDTANVVRRLVDASAPLAWRQRRVQVLCEAPDDLPPARADEQRLEQIVSNLLGNAIRHTPPGGMVAAAVCEETGNVSVEVRDTGEGIPAEDLPHVFERFFRGRSANGEGGAGLGLALVKELSEAMGGSVEAHSTPGEGSTFVVRLPAA
jgi:signal transduction histidine kinase